MLTHCVSVVEEIDKKNYCLDVTWIFQEDTAKYQRHLRLEHGVFYNRLGELMINYDEDDNDHDYGVFEYIYWLVGKFMVIDDDDADFLNRLGYFAKVRRPISWRHESLNM